ncbi:uncharacterized protein L969DRAFT_82619 [Mixia osmundae IAM 14324]|uniref:DNA topoisomerase 2 n=1 Tax=Mixia osmundae (strain CBS 9802 / IAM 14324 / JCM 22182 / KY 12970) TaxID=764103 RepID=G7DZ82_MIXOS|nr:uncharacterized protein L969DRAFT_82619 [Mixia osmundae IAM 14324]KEI38294.1 hypothetical protein L969DRAFT_82619 [Mixia osmundae IAM 14324]GAA95892.1 hypothetical protein E5Q_02550 [Mixia osmundae IAM 14324]
MASDSASSEFQGDDSSFCIGSSPAAPREITNVLGKTKAAASAGKKAAPKPKVVKPSQGSENVVPSTGPTDKVEKSASAKYQKITQLEHVLLRPDTYIGSVESITQPMWIWDATRSCMAQKTITFVPGLFKIFDEILVNAADAKQQCPSMSELKVNIDTEKGEISVWNNGMGIEVVIHEKENIYIPELIFGHLLTSSNYDDDDKKTTGGRNGYGAKLANIYSTSFTVETACQKSGKKYVQTWTNNMSSKGKAKITDTKKGEAYTKITFRPDFKRFGHMAEAGLDPDTEALLQKRVYDMAGTVKDVQVSLNGKKLRVNNFKKYVELYTRAVDEQGNVPTPTKARARSNSVVSATPALSQSQSQATDLAGAPPTGKSAQPGKIIYEQFGERWEVAFTVSDGDFNQVSFVNSIATTKGGTHVEHVAKQLTEGLIAAVKKKNKHANVKSSQIRPHLWIFINCLVENPSFDSQTKENLILPVGKFGSRCKVSEEFIKKITKSGVVDNVLNWAKFKEEQQLKKTDGHKRSRITGISKLEDANQAGTKNGRNCTLILTEGDSAKALAVSGLEVVGRDTFGVFPLRGKLLNVRESQGKTLTDNIEINAVKQIMGLQHGKTYESVDSLRYGHLMIMTDQDHDGSHIKGLIINFLDYFFPSLLRIPGFLVEFITPIVKISRARQERAFFTMPEYEAWKAENNDGRGWDIKYYKGLGTSTAADARKYFGDMDSHRLGFRVSDDADRSLIDMAFNKKKADDRKDWLASFIPGTFLDHSIKQIPISDFVNRELILYSMADNIRSIPSLVDGFKPGQRKVLFGCFKRNLKKEIKVAQLGGYVSEQSAYHHGEASLYGTIVGLAQNFVGSNNINLLDPNGQFGTRLQGGKDAASARYIFTNVAQITRTIFHPADDNLLTYLSDDGQSIEPSWYMPVIPMVLVNGSDGIGTGWSSTIPTYNPADIIANLRAKLADKDERIPLLPWYRGYKGEIVRLGADKFKCLGVWSQPDEDTLEITELPVRVWTQTYKELLEAWIQGTEKAPALIKDYKEYHANTTVHFKLQLTAKGKEAIAKDGIEKTFKLSSAVSTGNMVCFDLQGKIQKYSTPEAILDAFYDFRLTFYQKRKEYLTKELELAHQRLSNQARFILAIINKELVIANRKRAELVAELRAKSYQPFPRGKRVAVDVDEDDAANDALDLSAADYEYLFGLALSTLTAEKAAKLLAQRDEKEAELNILLAKTPKMLWIEDLDALQLSWQSALVEDENILKTSLSKAKAAARKGKSAKRAASSFDGSEDDDYKPGAKKAAVKKSKVDSSPAVSIASTASRAPFRKAKTNAKRATSILEESDEDDFLDFKKPVKATNAMVIDSPISSIATPVAKSKATKRAESVLSIADNESMKATPVSVDATPVAPKPKKAAEKPKAKTAKREQSIVELSDDEDDFSPGKSADSTPELILAPKPRAPARAAKTNAKRASSMLNSDESDEETYEPKKSKSRSRAKVADSDEDDFEP